jgi:hypothetical protein
LHQSVQRLRMGRYGAKKLYGATAGNQQRRKVVHLQRVHQVGLVLHIHPLQRSLREIVRQSCEQRRIVAASAAPLGAQTGNVQNGN